MVSSRVETLLGKLLEHRNNLDAFDFREAISNFSVLELQALSAGLDQAIPSRSLSVHAGSACYAENRSEQWPKLNPSDPTATAKTPEHLRI